MGNINTIKRPSKINKVNTATDLQFVAKFNVLFQLGESENSTRFLISEAKIHIYLIQRPKQSDIN